MEFDPIAGTLSAEDRVKQSRFRFGVAVTQCVVCCLAPLAAGQSRSIDRAEYAGRLHGMWLGECIANWTGLQTEGVRTAPPFFTDSDWGTIPPGYTNPITYRLNMSPWWADDDTDVEYVYLHLMSTQLGQAGPLLLSPQRIADGWRLHMDPAFIWVSNYAAWQLMGRGVRPPATGLPAANPYSAYIDAQLTTEFFGAICPGLPDQTLILADLPIRATSHGFATHAAQVFALLYSLAADCPPGLSGRDRALWLVDEAAKWIPPTSKSADIISFVRADFLASPDPDDWESTRDKIADRYMIHAAANGFQYLNWFESSVNFACGIMCLLYGECDYKKTIRIGTLSGWDSDNCTATMGGLLGLMLGYDQLVAQFPGFTPDDRFWIDRTRNNLPDYLPADPAADDTLSMMAARMIPLVDAAVYRAGGRVDMVTNHWILPPRIVSKHLAYNPGDQLQNRSANNAVRAAGGSVTAFSSAPSAPASPAAVYGSSDPGFFANGLEHDFSGRDLQETRRYFYSTQGSGQPSGTVQTLDVIYDRPREVWAVRFIEGDHFTAAGGFPAGSRGGWFTGAEVQVRVNGQWVSVPGSQTEPLDPDRPFQVIDFILTNPVQATGVRISGPSGGSDGFVTCTELDALSRPVSLGPVNGSRRP